AGVDLTSEGGSAGGHAASAAGPSLAVDMAPRHWTAGGRETALDRAHELVVRAVAEHRPPPLEPGGDAELRRLAGGGCEAWGGRGAATRIPLMIAQVLTPGRILSSPPAALRVAFGGLCCINRSWIRRTGGVRHRTFPTGGGGPP